MHTNYVLFAAYDDNDYTKIFFDTETGGFVVAHRKHGPYELKGNLMIAIPVAKHGYRIVLLENQQDVVSADATLDDEVWEFKGIWDTGNLANRVQKTIQKGKRQAANILVFINQAYNLNDISKGIDNAIKLDQKELIQKIGILFQNGRLIFMSRAEVIDKSFREKF
jgi:Contact-dependent growth inhibition CdiA C-terminal domain